MATIFLDIIYISIFYSSVATGDTGRFSAGMAILSLLLKPFSCCLVYHMHRERGGELPLRPGKSHPTLPPLGPAAARSLCCRPADGAVGTTPSFCFRPALALEVCSPAMWGIPLSGQAGQGTLCASLLASGPSHTVLSGGGASHFPALSDPILLWELGMDPR